MTIDEIIEGCELGGISLEQRLAVVEYGTLPRQQEEARLIAAELERRRAMRICPVFRHLVPALVSAMMIAAAPADAEVITWKNFQMPTENFVLPAGPVAAPQEDGGPTGSNVIWKKTNIPANPGFIKQQNASALTCSFTIDVHPTTSRAVYFALVVQDSARRNVNGVILDQGSQPTGWTNPATGAKPVDMFTLSWGGHHFTGLPAGQYYITLWTVTLDFSSMWLPSPLEYFQCFEVGLPPSQTGP